MVLCSDMISCHVVLAGKKWLSSHSCPASVEQILNAAQMIPQIQYTRDYGERKQLAEESQVTLSNSSADFSVSWVMNPKH